MLQLHRNIKMFHRQQLIQLIKQGLIYFLPLIIINAVISYTIYNQDLGSFKAVMQNNERQILDFQEELIKEHLVSLAEDINYIANLRLSKKYVFSGFDPEIDLSVVYSSFLKRRKIYSSVRIIDSDGFERFRLNYKEGVSKRIAEIDLQAKDDLFYFNEIMNSNPERNCFSELDLIFD